MDFRFVVYDVGCFLYCGGNGVAVDGGPTNTGAVRPPLSHIVSPTELFGENLPRTFGASARGKVIKAFVVHVFWTGAVATRSNFWKLSFSIVVGADLFAVGGSMTEGPTAFNVDVTIVVSTEGEGEDWPETMGPSAVISGFFPAKFALIIFIGVCSTTG